MRTRHSVNDDEKKQLRVDVIIWRKNSYEIYLTISTFYRMSRRFVVC